MLYHTLVFSEEFTVNVCILVVVCPAYVIVRAPFIANDIHFPLDFCSFVKYRFTILIWIHFWTVFYPFIHLTMPWRLEHCSTTVTSWSRVLSIYLLYSSILCWLFSWFSMKSLQSVDTYKITCMNFDGICTKSIEQVDKNWCFLHFKRGRVGERTLICLNRKILYSISDHNQVRCMPKAGNLNSLPEFGQVNIRSQMSHLDFGGS